MTRFIFPELYTREDWGLVTQAVTQSESFGVTSSPATENEDWSLVTTTEAQLTEVFPALVSGATLSEKNGEVFRGVGTARLSGDSTSNDSNREIVSGSLTLSGNRRESFKPATEIGSGSISAIRGSAEEFGPNPPEETLLYEVSGEKVEKNSFSYNQRSILIAQSPADYGGISSAPTSFDDYGYITTSEVSAALDYRYIYYSQDAYPFGTATLFGSAETVLNALAIHVGSGSATFSGNRVEKDTNRFIGTGSFSGISGSAEKSGSNPPEDTILFTFSGDRVERDTNRFIGSGSFSTFNGGAQVLGVNPPEDTVLFTFSGNRVEKDTNSFVGTGSFSGISGAAEVAGKDYEQISLFDISGEKIEKNSFSYNNNSIFIIDPTLDYGLVGIATDEATLDYGFVYNIIDEAIVDYGLVTPPFNENTYPYGTINISGAADFVLNALSIHVGSGSAEFSGNRVEKDTNSFVGSGSFSTISGAAEKSGSNPPEDTVLYIFSGDRVERDTNVFRGTGSFSAFNGSVEEYGPNPPESTLLFISSGVAREKDTFREIGLGSFSALRGSAESALVNPPEDTLLFNTSGEKIERNSFSYNQRSILTLDPPADYGGISSAPTSFDDYGYITTSEVSAALDYRYIYYSQDAYPFGTATLFGSAETVLNALAIHVGSGSATFSGNVVQKDISREIGSGSFSTISGSAEKLGSNPPEDTVLFTFSGDRVERDTNRFIGSGSFSTISGAAEKLGANPPEDTVLFTFSGNRVEKDTSREIGSGSFSALRGAAEVVSINYNQISLFDIFGEKVEKNSYSYNPRSIAVIDPSIDYGLVGIATDEATLDYGFVYNVVDEPIVDYEFVIPPFSETTYPYGTVNISGAADFVLNALSIHVGSGSAEFSGIARERDSNSFVGDGSFSTISGAAEKSGSNPPEDTVLFTFSGDRVERDTNRFIGSGSFFAITGSSESLGSNPPEDTVLFTFSGNRVEKDTNSFVGTGSFSVSNGAVEVLKFNPLEETVLLTLSGDKVEKDTNRFIGSGSFSAITGAAESLGSNPPEDTVLFTFSGNRVEKDTNSFVGTGSFSGISGAAEVFKSNPQEETVLFAFTGDRIERNSYSYNERSIAVIDPSIDYGLVGIATDEATLDYGFVYNNIDEVTNDYGLLSIPFSETTYPYGTVRISGDAEVALNALSIHVGSGSAEFSGNRVEKDTNSFVGDGSFSALRGAGEVFGANPPEDTVLFTFSGDRVERNSFSYNERSIEPAGFVASTINDGLLVGPTFNGQYNGGFVFNGISDYVDIGDGYSDFTSGLTISAFVNFGSQNNWERIVDLGNGQPFDNIVFSRKNLTNSLFFQTYNGSASQGSAEVADGILNDQIAHYAVKLDGVNCTFYRNGVGISTQAYSNLPTNVLRTLNYIGRSNFLADDYFGGTVYQIAIYNRPLTNAEILQNYNAVGNRLGLTSNSGITTSTGLILHLDASIENSYEGSGSKWFNVPIISGQITPYGSATFGGSALESAKPSPFIGSGFAEFSGNRVEKDTNSFVGTGSFSTISGAAEKLGANPPEDTVLFTFSSGDRVEKDTNVFRGTGSFSASNAAVTNLEIQYTFDASGTSNISGIAREKDTSREIGSGSFSALRGAAEVVGANPPEDIVLFTVSGEKVERNSYSYNERSIAVIDPSIDYGLVGIATDEPTLDYGFVYNVVDEPIVDYEFVIPPFSETTYPYGTVRISGDAEVALNALSIHVGSGSAEFSGIARERDSNSFVGDGSFSALRGSAEVFGANPPERTVLFTFSGDRVERDTNVFRGTGSFSAINGSAESSGRSTRETLSITISGNKVEKETNVFVGSGTITLLEGSADVSGTRPNYIPAQITVLGEKVERNTFSYNEYATVLVQPAADYGSISTIATSFDDYGYITTSEVNAALDYRYIYYAADVRPYGTIEITGSADSVFNALSIHVGSGSATFSGNRVEKDTSREIGSGSFSALRGSAEVFGANPPERTVLFTVTGDRVERDTNVFRGTGSFSAISGAAEEVTYNPVEETIVYSFSGIAREKDTSREIGSGSFSALRGAAEVVGANPPEDIVLFTVSGEKVERNSYSYNQRSIVIVDPIVDYGLVGISTDEPTLDYGFVYNVVDESVEDYELISIPFSETTYPFGTVQISGASPTEYVPSFVSSGIVTFSGSAPQSFTPSTAIGFGTFFALRGSAEVFGANPPEDTVLFTFTGDRVERDTNAFRGSGSASLSGAVYVPLAPAYDGSGTVTFSGSSTQSFTPATVIGSGSFSTISGSAEKLGSNPPEDTVLFTFTGDRVERDTNSFVGSGSFSTISGSAEKLGANPPEDTVLFTVSGNRLEKDTNVFIGSGSFSTISGAAEKLGSNPPEDTVLFNITGDRVEKDTNRFIGSGSFSTISGSAEKLGANPPEDTVLFTFSGNRVEKDTNSFVGSGSFSTISGSAEKLGSNPPEDTVLFTFTGDRVERDTNSFVGSGVKSISGSSVPRSSFSHIGSGTAIFSGAATQSFTPATAIGSGSFSALRGAGEVFGANPPERTVLFTFSGNRVEKDTNAFRGSGSFIYSGSAETALQGKPLIISDGEIITISGIAAQSFTPATAIGFGTFSAFRGSSEIFGANPPENTVLFRFDGSVSNIKRNFANRGSGNVEFNGTSVLKSKFSYQGTGTLSAITGAANALVVNPPEDTVLFTFSGNRVEKDTSREIGSGSFSAFNGAAEVFGANPPENIVLFEVSGNRVEKRSFSHNATGNITLSGSSQSQNISKNIGVGQAVFSGRGLESFIPTTAIGSGSFSAFNGAAEVFGANPPENIVLFGVSGNRVERRSFSQVGSGSIDVSGSMKQNVQVYVPYIIGSGNIVVTNSSENNLSIKIVNADGNVGISGKCKEIFNIGNQIGNGSAVFSGISTDRYNKFRLPRVYVTII